MDQTQHKQKGRPGLVEPGTAMEINERRDCNETARKNQPGRRCGFEHEDGEDLIDFPVGDTWLDFYHEQGLTPRHSDQFQQRPESDELHWQNEPLAMMPAEICEAYNDQ